MAWITPITNWIASNVLAPTDMNRIEGNTQDLQTNKVDKIAGKGLSTNDYTTTEKTKLSGIETGANNYVHPTGTNPHGTTKANVGLGSVFDYGIATQAEAEAGTSNVKYMTPLMVKQGVNVFGGLKFATGSYVGDNVVGRTISCGFAPKQIDVYGIGSSDGLVTAFKNGTTPIYVSHGSGTFVYAGITDIVLTSTGFTVSNDSGVNSSSMTYYWVAIA